MSSFIDNIDAVILANGDYPLHQLPLQILHNAKYIVCCDGGADAYIEKGFVPDAIIGDGDSISSENREIPNDEYVKNAYFTINENKEEIDELIGNHSKGWKTHRLTKISRSILRLGVYEMLFEKDIPYSVSINEAVELSKKFDDDKARAFVNGVLNSVKSELEQKNSKN